MEFVSNTIAAFLTICILSFLYKDNPFYKFAEHFFVGVSAGYWACQHFWTKLVPKLWKPLIEGENVASTGERWLYLIPLFLGFMMLCKLSSKVNWFGRWPIAFIVGTTIGLAIIGKTQANIVTQVYATAKPFHAMPSWMATAMDEDKNNLVSWEEMQKFKREYVLKVPSDINGDRWVSREEASTMPDNIFDNMDQNGDGFIAPAWEHREFKEHFPESVPGYFVRHDHNGDHNISDEERRTGHLRFWNSMTHRTIIDFLIIAIAVITSLLYFYFSKEHTGAMGVVSRIGICFLMVSFGAGFGYTVMARISLLIGRMIFIMKDWLGILA